MLMPQPLTRWPSYLIDTLMLSQLLEVNIYIHKLSFLLIHRPADGSRMLKRVPVAPERDTKDFNAASTRNRGPKAVWKTWNGAATRSGAELPVVLTKEVLRNLQVANPGFCRVEWRIGKSCWPNFR